jgi:CHAD domain-containing protein
VFAPLVDHEWAARLRGELGWAADQLGDARDTEVLLRRLTAHAASLPPRQEELTLRAVDKALQTRLSDARAQALAALSSPRHLALLETLVTAVGDPRLTEVARRPCREVLPPLVENSWRVLAKHVKQLDQDSPAPAWHRTRIDAKKARYATEAVAGIFGRRVKVLARALGDVTDVLGDQHDAAVAQEVLTSMADTPDVDGATGYALGLLSAHEQQDALTLRGDFRAVWPAAKKAHRQARPG